MTIKTNENTKHKQIKPDKKNEKGNLPSYGRSLHGKL